MKDNLKELLRVRNLGNNEAALYFYGEIVSSWWEAWDNSDKYPEAIRRFLDGLKGETLHIYVNSPGGAVFAGMAIYNMLSRYAGKKVVHIDGVAASIASVIAMAGDEIVMPSNTLLMVHKAIASAAGNSDEMLHFAELLAKVDESILSVYSKRLKNAAELEHVRELVAAESYLTAEETAGLFAGVNITEPIEMAACAKRDAAAIFAAAMETERLKLLGLRKR